MKKYQFRLERLMRLRERVRDHKRLAYAHAVDYRQRVELQMSQIEEYRQSELAQLKERLSEAHIGVEHAIDARNFDGVLVGLNQQLNRQLHQIKQVIRSRREDLMTSEREVRILEKLEERERGRYDSAVNRAEREEMDEYGSRKFTTIDPTSKNVT